jgi:peptidyl-prolyl cis-trans isomerase B (cyclophilin B)
MRIPVACRVPVVVLALAAVAAGCGENSDEEGAGLPPGCKRVPEPAPKRVDLRPPKARAAPSKPLSAVVETSCGDFRIALATTRAPKTTGSFVHLARHRVYEDTPFHYMDRAVIQGGDPRGNGTGGPGYFIDEPPPPNLAYTRGTVAMARTEVEPPGRSGSQFFVVTAADAGLAPTLALLGRITEGMDVVDRIRSLRGAGDKPRAPVVIERVTLSDGAGTRG